MEYYSMAEIWDLRDYPKSFYTHVIFRNGDDYFSVRLQERAAGPEDLPVIDPSRLQKILPEHIWFLLEDGLTLCPDPERPDIYVKQPDILRYDDSALPLPSLFLLQEARICEMLLDHTHENVARYLGCVVKAGRFTGLCFQKYAETLRGRLEAGRLVDKEKCLAQVRAGIDHLHVINLVHNDINTGNVMFTDRSGGEAVIIDFDSCCIEGHALPAKRGPMPKGAFSAVFEKDDFAFKILQEKLTKGEQAVSE